MLLIQVAVLAIVQGITELLPVSSSAHVIVAEKLMGLDPSAPEMTFLLVMLHTGTMLAVLLHFWPRWRAAVSADGLGSLIRSLAIATVCTGVVGIGLKIAIEHTFFRGTDNAEIEQLFKNLHLMGASLFAAGILIIGSGLWARRRGASSREALNDLSLVIIGVVQGLCLPFRGFSRSGATISVGMLRRLPREVAESFSFALAVILTPPVVLLELYRLLKHGGGLNTLPLNTFMPGLIGMILSFTAGLGALRWLSRWLETGRWHFFGYYCLGASALVFTMAQAGL